MKKVSPYGETFYLKLFMKGAEGERFELSKPLYKT